MEHVIRSMLTIKYSITASWEEAEKIMNEFFHRQVYKGNMPDEFYNRPTILKENSLCRTTNISLVVAYQIVELEYSVEKTLTDVKFLRLFKAQFLMNLRKRYEVDNYDQIQDLKVLDHVILSREDSDD